MTPLLWCAQLNLSSNLLRAEGAKALAPAIAGSASLTSLDVSYNNIKGSGEALGEALKNNSSLKELKMAECSFDAEDVKGLAGGLAVHGSLTTLSLSGNPVGDDGAKALAAALKDSKMLKELNVQSTFFTETGIGAEGHAALEEAVRDKEGFKLLI